MSLRPTREIEREKRELVAEQSGLTWAAASLLLGVALGVGLRAQISQERVTSWTEAALSKLDPSFEVRFSSARFSLANGARPEVALVLTELSFGSNEACWMAPLLEISELRVPVRLGALWEGRWEIDQLRATQATLALRADLSECRRKASGTTAATQSQLPTATRRSPTLPAAAATAASQSIEQTEEQVSAAPSSPMMNMISGVFADQLTIYYLPVAFTSVRIDGFSASVESSPLRKARFSGQLQVGGETLFGDYSSRAQLELTYQDDVQPVWAGRLAGNWREGHYSFDGRYLPLHQSLETSGKLDHIPLNQVLPLLRKHRVISKDYNGKDIWVSGQFVSSANLTEGRMPVDLRELRLDGDIGEIDIKRVLISDLAKGRFEPFYADVRSLHLETLRRFLQQHEPFPSLGNLGVFRGRMEVRAPNFINVQGEHSGLEFIFSNQGQRQSQNLSLITGKMELREKGWTLAIDSIRPTEGLFIGKVEVESSGWFEDLRARMRIDDLTLGPEVQRLITGGGQLASLAGSINLQLQGGKIHQVTGWLDAPEITVAKSVLKRPRVQLQTRGKTISAQITLRHGEIPLNASWLEPLQSLLPPPAPESIVQLTSAQLNVDWPPDYGIKWNVQLPKIQFTSGGTQSLRSAGVIKSNGDLSGDLQFFNSSSWTQWKLTGNRDKPQLLPDHAPRKREQKPPEEI